jgi:membrane protein YqaA with SNARE-associated domain
MGNPARRKGRDNAQDATAVWYPVLRRRATALRYRPVQHRKAALHGGCTASFIALVVAQRRVARFLYLAQPTMETWIDHLLSLLALPQYSLPGVFVVAFVSATLLPMGSEPAVYGLVRLNPDMLWQVIAVATAGNTLGGAVDWWLGYGAHRVADKYQRSSVHIRALDWLNRLGPKACLLAWLPLVGDPLCAVAGWLKLPFWPCVFYMAIGKFLRYVFMTAVLLGVFG